MRRDLKAKNQPALLKNKRVNQDNVLWTQTTTSTELKEIYDNTSIIIKERAGFTSDSTRRQCVAIYNMCFEKIIKTDRTRLTERQAHIYFLLIHEVFPTLISQLRTNLWVKPYENDSMRIFTKTITDIMKTYVDFFPRNVAPSRQKNVEEPTQKPSELKDPEAQDALAKVNTLLTQVNSYTTTVEDQFLIQQIASSYLPEAVKLYRGLSTAPQALQAEVKSIFLKQLVIMTAQLETVHDAGAQQQLNSMKAHLQFLETKQKMTLN